MQSFTLTLNYTIQVEKCSENNTFSKCDILRYKNYNLIELYLFRVKTGNVKFTKFYEIC